MNDFSIRDFDDLTTNNIWVSALNSLPCWVKEILLKPKKITINLDYANRVLWLISLIQHINSWDLSMDFLFDTLKIYSEDEKSKPSRYIDYYGIDSYDDFSFIDRDRILTIDIILKRILEFKWNLKWFTMALLAFHNNIYNNQIEIKIDFQENPELFMTEIDMNKL